MSSPKSLDIPDVDFADINHILARLPSLDVFYKDLLTHHTVLNNGWDMYSNRVYAEPHGGEAPTYTESWVLTQYTVANTYALQASIADEMPALKPMMTGLLEATDTDGYGVGSITPFNDNLVTHLSVTRGAGTTYVVGVLSLPRRQIDLDVLRQHILTHVADLM